MNTTVILTSSDSEVKFAISYQKSNADKKVIILTPTLTGQKLLRNLGLNYFDYFKYGHVSHSDYYQKYFWNFEIKVTYLVQKVLKNLVARFPDFKKWILPNQDWLELVYLEVLDTYQYWLSINKLLPGSHYLKFYYHNKIRTDIYYPYQSQMQILSMFVPKHRITIIDKHNFLEKIIKIFINLYIYIQIIPNLLINVNTIIHRLITNYLTDKKLYKTDILIYSAGRNLLYYESLIKLLNKEKIYKGIQILTGFQTIEDEVVLNNTGFKYISANNVIPNEFNKKKDNLKKKLISRLKNIYTSYDYSTSLSGFTNISKIISQTDIAEYSIKMIKPRLLITTHDPGPTALPFVLAAKKMKIKSLLLMHGWQNTLIGNRYYSDYIVVWGKYIAKWYKKRLRYNPKKILAIGYPALDKYFKNKQAFWKKRQILPTFKQKTNLGLLLTMYLPNTALLSKFLTELFCELRNNHNFIINIRLHPGQPSDGFKTLAKEFGINARFGQSVTLDNFIKNNDFLLVWDTTAIIWCMIYGKPLFYCAPNWGLGITPINKFGGAWLVNSPSDLLIKIENYIKNPKIIYKLHKKQKIFLKNIMGIIDGSSSKRHKNLILNLLKRSKY